LSKVEALFTKNGEVGRGGGFEQKEKNGFYSQEGLRIIRKK